MHVLDNAVWNALAGPQAEFALGSDDARRFRTDVAPFAALPDHPTPADWDALATLLGDSGAVLFRTPLAVPDGWVVDFRFGGHQLVADGPLAPPAERPDGSTAPPKVVDLGPEHAEEMVALAERTRPGPFLARTVELGGYLGVREDDGTLVAMTGRRIRPPGHTEISAVCTDERHRGRGLASLLVRAVVERARDDGDRAFLHVAADNTTAIRLYEALGFTRRVDVEVIGLHRPGASTPGTSVPGHS